MSDELKEKLNKIELTKEVRTLVIKALGAYKKGDLNEAAVYYEKAAEISNKLGHPDLADQYKGKAASLRTGEKTIETKLNEKEKHSIEMLSKAEEYINKGEFGKAAVVFEKAAEMAPKDRATEFRREANELFKKEKEMESIRTTIRIREESKNRYSELLEKIKDSIKKGDVDNAVNYIEKAIAIAKELGKKNDIEKLREQALELKKSKIEKMETEKKEKKGFSERGEIVEEYTKVLEELKKALTTNNYKLAFEMYIKAGNLALQMGEPDRAELYRKKAEELREEVAKQEEKEKLLKRKEELLNNIDKLDEKRSPDELILYYTELIDTLYDLGETNEVQTYKNKIEKLKLIKERQDLENQAKEALDEKNFERGLKFYKEAAKISLKLGDNITYSDEIKDIETKVEKVSMHRSLIDNRSIAIANAKKFMDENNYDAAIKEFKEAARISDELGEIEIAQSYRETAERLNKDRDIIKEKNKFIKEAEEAIKEKNYKLASDYFEQAAKFCEKLSELKEAEKFRKKAKVISELAKID
ncbi:MAG: hypothetical protein ACTSYZ_15130 [Candidatus Helarchaeota archaeon]